MIIYTHLCTVLEVSTAWSTSVLSDIQTDDECCGGNKTNKITFNQRLKKKYELLTFLATKKTISNATMKQPATILVVRSFVDASTKTIPQNDDPRSGW